MESEAHSVKSIILGFRLHRHGPVTSTLEMYTFLSNVGLASSKVCSIDCWKYI